jgi:hypothetical protein
MIASFQVGHQSASVFVLKRALTERVVVRDRPRLSIELANAVGLGICAHIEITRGPSRRPTVPLAMD